MARASSTPTPTRPSSSGSCSGSTARPSPTLRCVLPAWRTLTCLWSGSSSPDAKGERRASSRRWSDEPVDGCRGGGDQARRDRTAADPHQRPGHVELRVLADGLACRYVLPPRPQGTWHGLLARGDVDTERD